MMKKSFTLIELMVTIVLSFVIFNFIFTYQFNFLKELKYIEAKEKLAMESFRLMEVATKGASDLSGYIPGIVGLRSYGGTMDYIPHLDDPHPVTFSIISNNFNMYQNPPGVGDNNFRYMLLDIDNASLNIAFDKDNNENGIYSFEFNSSVTPKHNLLIENPRYPRYTRLVYTR